MKVRTDESRFTHLRILKENLITHKKLLFSAIILVSTMIFLFPFCSGGKAGNMPKPKVLNICDLREIPQDENYIVSNPLKMVCCGDKIYVLDRKLQRILVFTDTGYSHSIGRPGQGPGEISQPISFDIGGQIGTGDLLYFDLFT